MTDRQTERTGYPSIDKPWLKYYTSDQIEAPLPKCSLYEYLWDCNKDHLEDYALNFFGKRMTFGILFERINQAAKAFQAIGVKEGDIVSLVTVSAVPSVISLYAINRIGAVANYLNVLSEEKDLINFFNEAHSSVVVALDLFADKVLLAAKKAKVETVILFSIDYGMPTLTKMGYWLKNGHKKAYGDKCIIWNDFIKLGNHLSEIHYNKDPQKMCLLAHTGGTTGEPKGVMLSDYALNAVTSQYRAAAGIKRRGVCLNLMIPFVVYGLLINLHMPLCLGLENVLIPKFDSKEWKKYIKKYRPNHALTVPAYVIPMMSDESLSSMDLSCFEILAVGGDGMTPEIEKDMKKFLMHHGCSGNLVKGYGMTEVAATAITEFSYVSRNAGVGIPMPKNNLMIYDIENGRELTYNEVGEVCLQCPSRMIGYLNNEEATRQLFRVHEDGSEWLHTGDLGYVDEDGFLFLVGRMKRVILTTKDGVAYKVFPNIPEKVLEENESVNQSCIVGAEENENQVLKAFVVIEESLMPEVDRIEQELRRCCEERLPSYQRPAFYEFRTELPLTAAGKVDYRALEEMQK